MVNVPLADDGAHARAMATDDILVIGDYGALQRRTTKTGKSRYTVEMSSTPLVINTDAKTLGRPVAMAIANHLRMRIETISAAASPATVRARKNASKALSDGTEWARQRYSGGRIGMLPPNQSDRLFNDSGRFARGIAVGANGDGWIINAAANRLKAAFLDGKNPEAALVTIFQKLRQLVPEFGNAGLMRDALLVRKAIRDVQQKMIVKATDQSVELRKQLLRSQFEVFEALVG